VTHLQPDCRIYLVVEATPAAVEHLTAATEVADVACCLIVPAAGAAIEAAAARPLIAAAQQAGVAALIAEATELVRTLRADGVHLNPTRQLLDAHAAARNTLGREAIVGADVGVSRHDAMSLAEAGADYIAFGAPSHLKDGPRARERRDDLVSWWGEIFEVPCVALDVEGPSEAERLARAGANFVAVTVPGGSAAATRALVAEIAAAIASKAAAGLRD
jgi:thiamine-phosphate pyrophosphorylase